MFASRAISMLRDAEKAEEAFVRNAIAYIVDRGLIQPYSGRFFRTSV